MERAKYDPATELLLKQRRIEFWEEHGELPVEMIELDLDDEAMLYLGNSGDRRLFV